MRADKKPRPNTSRVIGDFTLLPDAFAVAGLRRSAAAADGRRCATAISPPRWPTPAAPREDALSISRLTLIAAYAGDGIATDGFWPMRLRRRLTVRFCFFAVDA